MGDIARSLQLHGGLPGGVALTMKNAFSEIMNVKMDDAQDVSGGGTTRAVGFQVTDFSGANLSTQVKLELAASDDVGLTQPATNATLNTATQGTILDGAASNTLIVQTSTSGRFTCTLTDFSDETVFLSCKSVHGTPLIDCREFDSVTFSA